MLPTIGVQELHTGCVSVLRACGLSEAAASAAADVVVYAETRGYPTHGLNALVRSYVPGLRSGRIDPAAKLEIVRRTGAVAAADGNRALGLVSAAEAMDLACGIAAESGVGFVTVRNSTHFGAAGAYAHRAARVGMIGLAMTNCGRQGVIPPLGGTVRMLGTNPLGAAVPGGERDPFVLDMSATVAATGKVNQARKRGERVPEGWLIRPDGTGTTDPAEYADGTADVLWLGGLRETGGAKGFGLGLLVDLLCGPLAGAGYGPRPAAFDGPQEDDDIGHVLIAVSPEAFGHRADFERSVDELLGTVVACPPAAYADRVAYPGLPEAERAAGAEADGVPVAADLVAELGEITTELAVPALPFRAPAGGEG
ncbi:Ldh family oxidoreductase [Streptomyces sp. NPDC006235]|uniref:Ldh family oxidoreductase n=1 Tax=Streptomyces sp. NPDC006235 TaxID=3156736 RepID=UPI0033B27CBD